MTTAVTTVATTQHPMLKQLELALSGTSGGNHDEESLDVSFMSKSFCLSGLPLRRLQNMREFHRNDDSFSLSINSPSIMLPGGDAVEIGLPYGARARLLILWMTTLARANGRTPGDRWLEIGKIDEWLEEVGITPHTENAAMAKEQLIRLSFANFTMVMRKEGLDYFRSDRLTESAVFAEEDLLHYAAGNLAKVRFPLGVELSEKAYQRFTGKDAIPIPTQALRKISNNAMALDIFVYLCFKLPSLGKNESVLLSWKALIKQFGNKEAKSKFRQVFDVSIAKALDAYEGARVDVTDEGLILHYADPAELRKLFVARPKPLLAGPPKRRNRIAPPPAAASVAAGLDL